jgi:hypothetical protein
LFRRAAPNCGKANAAHHPGRLHAICNCGSVTHPIAHIRLQVSAWKRRSRCFRTPSTRPEQACARGPRPAARTTSDGVDSHPFSSPAAPGRYGVILRMGHPFRLAALAGNAITNESRHRHPGVV